METTSRPCASAADQLQMWALARQFPADNLRVTDLTYRLSSWALDDPANARLWFDTKGSLLAWAALQTPFWFIDYAIHPEAAQLHPEILAWADQHARQVSGTLYGHPSWFVAVFSDQAERRRELEAAGFANQANLGENSWSKVLLQRPGKLPVQKVAIAPGFSVRPLAGAGEVEAYVNLHQTVFESKNMTVAWRQRTLEHPYYNPDLDLVVAAPDGRLAAFCIGWLNRAAGRLIGQIEPLGVHPAFRHQALGRAALAETLRRLQSHGVEIVHVETDSYRNAAFQLYESLGFSIAREVLVYRKDYEKR